MTLDGGSSFDPDPGDAVALYQWFEGDAGLGNSPVVTAHAARGSNHYRLHVYDDELASHSREVRIDVVDTTPPQLSFTESEYCLWPPNHEFALFRLGQEIPFTVTDACDAQPTVEIVSLVSDEAVDLRGSGSTAPDAFHGINAGCVRSERSGTRAGRNYTLTVEAKDRDGNATRKSVRIVVPHDQSDRPDCRRALGLAPTDPRCSQ